MTIQTNEYNAIKDFEINADRAFWFAEEPYETSVQHSHNRRSDTKRRSISSAIKVRRRVPQLADESGRQMRDLIEKNMQLQEMNRVYASYMGDLAHEMRNTLVTLNFYMELAATGHSAKHAHYQWMALQSAGHLRQLVEDCLIHAQLNTTTAQRREMQEVDLNQLISEIMLLHQAQAEAAGLMLTFEAAKEIAPILGDPLCLAQVFVNLVTNAIKYTKTGWIQVKVRGLPCKVIGNNLGEGERGKAAVTRIITEVMVDVTDSGIGIDPSDLPYIFERFYRAQDEQIDTIPGTGLGLAIVKEIVDQHQGTISVDSALGTGSRFRLRFPAICAT